MGNNSFFNSKAVPYNMTEEGAAVYRDMLKAVNETFPQYLEELRGMADGLGLDFSTVRVVAIINCAGLPPCKPGI